MLPERWSKSIQSLEKLKVCSISLAQDLESSSAGDDKLNLKVYYKHKSILLKYKTIIKYKSIVYM